MATYEVLELNNYDDIKRILNRNELQEYNTYQQYFKEIDNMFHNIRQQIFNGFMLGAYKFIPYDLLFNNDYIRNNFPYVLTYYKNKFYEFIKDLSYYLDLYIVGNFEGLEDGAVIETSKVFDTLYNFIWAQNYEYFYSVYFDDIYTLIIVDDYDATKQIFSKYFNEIIDQNINTMKKLIEIIDKRKTDTELLRMYLSIKGIDTENIKNILKSLDNELLSEFNIWLTNLLNGIRQIILLQTRARDSVISTLNNPDKRIQFKELMQIISSQ